MISSRCEGGEFVVVDLVFYVGLWRKMVGSQWLVIMVGSCIDILKHKMKMLK